MTSHQALHDSILSIYSQYQEQQESIRKDFHHNFMGLLEELKGVTGAIEEVSQWVT